MKFVIVGGGIAGVSCATRLLEEASEEDVVVLISSSPHVKTVVNWTKVGQFTELFNVKDDILFKENARLTFIRGEVVSWDHLSKCVRLSSGATVSFDRLCIATGASPKNKWTDERIISLRDTDSALNLGERLKNARQVVIVGNGGIATEIVYELQNVNIHWVIRDDSVSSTFFVPPAVRFFERRIQQGRTSGSKLEGVLKRDKFTVENGAPVVGRGCALGPDWSTVLSLEGASTSFAHSVVVHPSTEVVDIDCRPEDLVVRTSSGETLHCDLVIWAVGVVPDSSRWTRDCSELKTSVSDGGIIVDEQMRTSIPDVFACGDVCCVEWPNQSDQWQQMRLWTQARQMGDYCARSMMCDGEIELDFCFELFAHVTNFFGFKVVLLGDFKGQRQPAGWYVVERFVSETQYVCCIMFDHRVVGAVMIGETDLEETIENLILNRTNLESLEDNFLDPGIDIEDYFD